MKHAAINNFFNDNNKELEKLERPRWIDEDGDDFLNRIISQQDNGQ